MGRNGIRVIHGQRSPPDHLPVSLGRLAVEAELLAGVGRCRGWRWGVLLGDEALERARRDQSDLRGVGRCRRRGGLLGNGGGCGGRGLGWCRGGGRRARRRGGCGGRGWVGRGRRRAGRARGVAVAAVLVVVVGGRGGRVVRAVAACGRAGRARHERAQQHGRQHWQQDRDQSLEHRCLLGIPACAGGREYPFGVGVKPVLPLKAK